MITARSERFTFVSQKLQSELGSAVQQRLLRRVGRAPAMRTLATVMQEAELVRLACQEAQDPTLAARLGAQFRDAQTLVAYVSRSARSLREAVTYAAHFISLSDDTLELTLHKVGEMDVLQLRSTQNALALNHRYQEFLMFALLTRIRAVAGRVLRPQALLLAHPLPYGRETFEHIAGCPVHFGAEANGIHFAQGALDAKLDTHDPALVDHLRALGDAKLLEQARPKMSLRGRVERMLIDALPGTFLGADEVAARLGMTRRTLVRKLTAEGTTFRDLSAALRYSLAQTYLREGFGVSETSFLLGYADQATFSAAFRKWAGTTPTAFAKSG